MSNFKDIHIGKMIHKLVEEQDIDLLRVTKFTKCSVEEVLGIYQSSEVSTGILLSFSKLLNYDFFRIYSHHLILYSPPVNMIKGQVYKSTQLPQFRKNIYTKEMIDFILEMIDTNRKTKQQVQDEYGIPKTTLYKWIVKYSNK